MEGMERLGRLKEAVGQLCNTNRTGIVLLPIISSQWVCCHQYPHQTTELIYCNTSQLYNTVARQEPRARVVHLEYTLTNSSATALTQVASCKAVIMAT